MPASRVVDHHTTDAQLARLTLLERESGIAITQPSTVRVLVQLGTIFHRVVQHDWRMQHLTRTERNLSAVPLTRTRHTHLVWRWPNRRSGRRETGFTNHLRALWGRVCCAWLANDRGIIFVNNLFTVIIIPWAMPYLARVVPNWGTIALCAMGRFVGLLALALALAFGDRVVSNFGAVALDVKVENMHEPARNGAEEDRQEGPDDHEHNVKHLGFSGHWLGVARALYPCSA